MVKYIGVVMLFISTHAFAQDSLKRFKRANHALDSAGSKIQADNSFYFSRITKNFSVPGVSTKVTPDNSFNLLTKSLQHKVDSMERKPKSEFSNNPMKGVYNAQLLLNAELNYETVPLKQLTIKSQNKIRKNAMFADSLSRYNLRAPKGSSALSLQGEERMLLPDAAISPSFPTVSKGLNLSSEPNALQKELALPNMSESIPLTKDISAMEKLPAAELSEVNVLKPLSEVKADEQKVNLLDQKTGRYEKGLQKIKNGDTTELKEISKKTETAVMGSKELVPLKTEVAQAQTTRNALQQYQESMSQLTNGGDLKKVESLSSKELKDPFAGKSEKLQSGIAELERLKRKYGTVPDSRYMPRHVPNQLKGKPFRERLIPGVNYQIFKNEYTVADLMPFLVYRLTTRFSAGLGYTYRFNFDDRQKVLIHARRAYGYRYMSDFAIASGFLIHGEVEVINFQTYNPFSSTPPDPMQPRKWIPGLYAGVLKSYKISHLLNGKLAALYNFHYAKNGLYPTKFNLRFGIEFDLKKKRRKFSMPLKTDAVE